MQSPSIKKNYLYNLSYQVLTLLTPLVTAPYVSRVLGADGIGINSYSSSIMAYFTMFAQLGTSSYGQREIARLRDSQYDMSKAFWEIEAVSIIATIFCLGGWMLLISYSEFYKYFFLALTPTLLAAAFDVSWFYSGIERVGYTVFRNAVCKIIGIVFLFLLVREKDDLLLYISLHSVILLIGNISMWSYLPKFIIRIPIRSLVLYKHLKETLSYFLITITVSLYTVMDKVLIGLLTGDSFQNGYYEQANKIIKLVSVLSFSTLNRVMGARLSYLFAKNDFSEVRRRIDNSMNFILFTTIGSVSVIISISNIFVPVFFGDGFEPVEVLLPLMSPLIVFIGISTCLGSHLFMPSGQIKLSTKMIVRTAIINILLNILLIPPYGAIGAVISSLIAEGTNTIMYIYYGRSYFSPYLYLKIGIKRFFAGLITWIGCGTFLMNDILDRGVFSLFVMIVLALFIYIVSLMLMRDAIIFDSFFYLKKNVLKHFPKILP